MNVFGRVSFPLIGFAAITLFAFLVHASNANAQLEIAAREYLLVDFDTGTELASVNADEKMPPSSMSKLMTAYMVFDALKSGRISLDDEMTVSANAWRIGGAASSRARPS